MKSFRLLAAAMVICAVSIANGKETPGHEPQLVAADIQMMKLLMDSPEILRAAGLDCHDPTAELDMRRGTILGRAVTVGYRKGAASLLHLRGLREAETTALTGELIRTFGQPAYDRQGCTGWTQVPVGKITVTIEILDDPDGGKVVAIF